MSRVYPEIHAFVGGILSRRMDGRFDFAKYGVGCRVLDNMIVTPTGGAYKRPGLRFVAEAKQPGGIRLIPFDFNGTESQSYVIELGNGYARFYTRGGRLMNGDEPFELSVPLIEGIDLTLLNYVQSADVVYFAHPHMQPWRLERHGSLAWVYQPLSFLTDKNWPLPFAAGNWPSRVRIYEDRLWFAATPKQPLNLWGSRTADFLDFRINTASDSTDPPLATDAIFLRLNGSRVNPIMWMLDMEQLVVGTNASEIRVMGSEVDAPLTPETAGHKRQSSYGSNSVQAILLSESAIFVSRTGNMVYTLDYQEFGYRFTADQLNITAPEVVEPGVVELHGTAEPEPIVWCLLANGELAGCTYIKSQNIYAWHRHRTDGKILSAAVIPYLEGDQLWVVVQRENGTFIEYLETPFDPFSEDATYTVLMDSLLSGTAENDGIIYGMPHLAGQTVQVVANGSYLGEFTVAEDGSVTSEKIRANMYVAAGLPYTAMLQPMRPNYALQTGQAVSTRKRVVGVQLRVLGSIMGEVRAEYDGEEFGEWQEIISFPHGAIGGQPPQCRSETMRVSLAGNTGFDGLVSVRQRAPFPLYCISLTYVIDQG